MGVSYRAYNIIGVPIDSRRLKEALTKPPVKQRGCSHPLPNQSFCGICGFPSWVESEEEPIEELEDIDHMGFRGWGVVSIPRTTMLIIGKYKTEATIYDPHSSIHLGTVHLHELKALLQETLTPLGLWDGSKYGLHTILDCS